MTLDVPAREDDERVLDLAGILDVDVVAAELAALDGADVVALTVEDQDASLGQADRLGRRLLQEWEADVALVVVGRPGDLRSTDADRERFFGVVPVDPRGVSGGMRERIAEEVVPPLAADNDWTAVFTAAAAELRAELGS